MSSSVSGCAVQFLSPLAQSHSKTGIMLCSQPTVCVCVCVGVGGAGPGGFGEVGGEVSHFCAGLGEKFQSSEIQRERVRTPAQVYIAIKKKDQIQTHFQ